MARQIFWGKDVINKQPAPSKNNRAQRTVFFTFRGGSQEGHNSGSKEENWHWQMVLYKLTQYQLGYIVWIEWKGEWLYKYIDSDQWTLYKLNELQKADGYISSERLYQRVTVMSGSLGSRVLSRRGDLCCQNIRPNVPNLTIKRWATNECTILFQSINYSIGQIIQINEV